MAQHLLSRLVDHTCDFPGDLEKNRSIPEAVGLCQPGLVLYQERHCQFDVTTEELGDALIFGLVGSNTTTEIPHQRHAVTDRVGEAGAEYKNVRGLKDR